MNIRKTMVWVWLGIGCAVAISCDDDKMTADKNPRPPGPATQLQPAVKVAGGALNSSSAPAWKTVDGSMAAFFKTPVPTSAPATAVPPLTELVGEWRATITRVQFDDDKSGMGVSADSIPPFSFSIKREGDKFLMVSSDGKGSPRALTANASGWVASGSDGRAPLELRYSEGALNGVLPLVKGKAEFHAVRNR